MPVMPSGSAREPVAGTFLASLESGRLDWNTLHPFHVPDATSGTAADALIKEITAWVAAEVDPEQTDVTGDLPPGLIDELRDGGWFRLRNAAALGGHELSDYNAFRLVERVCAVSLPVGQTLAIQNAVGAATLLAALRAGPLRAKVEMGKRLGRIIRREVGEDPHIAFDNNGRATFAGVLCLAPEPGLGITDPDTRARIGEERLNPLRAPAVAAR